VTTRPGYTALAVQLASVRPSATKAAEYVPTNTADPVCHNLLLENYFDYTTNSTHNIEISPVLPVPHSPILCSCMMKSLECFVSSRTPPDPAQDLMAAICQRDESLCTGIRNSFKTGQYGAYTQCTVTEKTAWVANQFYLSKKDPAACASVNGTIQRAVPSASQSSSCDMLLRQAGPDGSGTITAFPASATGSVPSKSSNSQIRGSNWDSLKVAAKAGIIISAITTGLLFFALALCLAMRTKRRAKGFVKDDAFQKAELPDNQVSLAVGHISGKDGHPQNEIDGSPRVEMPADVKGWELAARENQVHELEASNGLSELNGKPLCLKEPKGKT
jgi:hypothetical protein